MAKDVYLLGGKDGEMNHIQKKLERNQVPYLNKNLAWGAKIDDYHDEVKNILQQGDTPVAIELSGAGENPQVVDIDHHNEKSNRPAALTQVMERLNLPMTMYDKLIAANDSGFIPGMEEEMEKYREKISKEQGEEIFERAKRNLISLVRLNDRKSQGITEEQEEQADIAVKSREDLLGGKLTIVRLPHSKSATVTDRLFGTYENLLVISADGESNFFGDGEVCQAFKDQYPNSWAGGTGLGKAKEYAFWGGYVDQKVLEEEIKTEVLRTLPPAEIIEGDLLPAISFYPIPDQMINLSESLTLDLKEYIPIYGGSIISKYRLLGDVEGVKFDAKNAIFQFNPKSPGVYCFNFQYLDEDGWSAQDFAVHVCSDFD